MRGAVAETGFGGRVLEVGRVGLNEAQILRIAEDGFGRDELDFRMLRIVLQERPELVELVRSMI